MINQIHILVDSTPVEVLLESTIEVYINRSPISVYLTKIVPIIDPDLVDATSNSLVDGSGNNLTITFAS